MAGNLDHVDEGVFDHPIDPERLAAFLALPHAALFADLAGGEVVGQVRGFVHPQPDGRPELYIDNLGVTPGRQREGLATLLMEAIIDWAREKGCAIHWLLTEPENAQGLAFYGARKMTRKTSVFFEGEIK